MVGTQPLISVIIPVFNAEQYIKLALDSICKQTYKNLEIIVIDDGSSDQSKAVIEKYEDHRIRFISRENRGLIYTLNEAINISTGEYIARMDADDISAKERLEKQLQFLRNNNDVGVVFTGIEYISETGVVIRSKISKTTRKIDPVELLFGCPLCHPTAMFDMTKLSKRDIHYDSNYHLAEDFELWTRLISITQIGLLNEVFFSYRIHSASITTQNGSKQRLVAIRAINKNLATSASNSVSSSLSTIYNNHLGNESAFKTIFSVLLVGLKLKSINSDFSLKKYLTKSYYLVRNKFSQDYAKELRK